MSTRHKWADVITAWANGEAIQCQSETMSGWSDHYPSDSHGTPLWNNPDYRWRIKPRMCSLNGYEFPAPERIPPKGGTEYYYSLPERPSMHGRYVWATTPAGSPGDSTDRRLLHRGRVHLSREAAIAHARAEILAVGGTLENES